MSYPLYQIDLTAERVGIEVRLNDFPIGDLDGFRAGFYSFCAHSHLRSGSNVLDILIGMPDEDTHVIKEPPANALVKAAFVQYKDGDFPGEGGRVFSEFKWQPSEKLPVRHRHEFEVNWDLGPWNWGTAPVINRVSDREAFEDAIRQLHAAFKAGDDKALLQWFEPYIEDELKAYPARTREWITGPLSRQVRANNDASSVVAPLNPAEWGLRFCADGRLVECVDREGRPLLRADRPAPYGPWALPVYLGWHQQKVRVLR